jgi:hypothetical protein
MDAGIVVCRLCDSHVMLDRFFQIGWTVAPRIGIGQIG